MINDRFFTIRKSPTVKEYYNTSTNLYLPQTYFSLSANVFPLVVLATSSEFLLLNASNTRLSLRARHI